MEKIYSPSGETIERFTLDIVSRTARDLTLLKAVDQTLDALSLDSGRLGADLKFAVEVTEKINKTKPQAMIDPAGNVDDNILRAQDSIKSVNIKYSEKRSHAENDNDLCEEDGVVEAFNKNIELSANLYNALSDLRWAIAEHDADLSPKLATSVCSSQQEIDAALT